MSTATTLSPNDSLILAALFDPETLPSSVSKKRDEVLISSSLPPLPTLSEEELVALEAEQNALIARATAGTETGRTVEGAEDVERAQEGKLKEAISELDSVVRANPGYPSALLNRAMLRRLALEAALPPTSNPPSEGTEGQKEKYTIFTAHPPSSLEPLFTDLSAAISLCLPPSSLSSPTPSPVSAYAARILRTAYSHRAYLYLKAAESHIIWAGEEAAGLEERASVDFASAARYGDEVAREMSVRTNPYARACGGIVREALRGEGV
jgi:hypothetical protein